MQRPAKFRILILGAGYAGLTCLLELQSHLSEEYDLALINADKYHWFTTELHTYVAGEAEETVRIPLERVVASPGRLVVGHVAAVDATQRQVTLADGQQIGYDLLVFALGADPEYYGLPGVAENSMIIGNYQGAAQVRSRIQDLQDGCQNVIAPHVVIAGGGLTGVELAGELADEYAARIRITVVEAGPDIMAGFAPDLVKRSREVLENKGIEICTGNPITRCEPGLITFKDGSQMACDLLVWSGGVRGSALLANSGLTTTRRGRGEVDLYLRAKGYPDVYLVGDSASFLDPATGREVLPTAQAAVQMGRRAGRNILRRLHNQAEEPFVPKNRGAFASLGRLEGVGQIGKSEYAGTSAMLVKGLIEAKHAWESKGGIMPIVSHIWKTPGRFLRGIYMPTKVLQRQRRRRKAPPTAGGSGNEQHIQH